MSSFVCCIWHDCGDMAIQDWFTRTDTVFACTNTAAINDPSGARRNAANEVVYRSVRDYLTISRSVGWKYMIVHNRILSLSRYRLLALDCFVFCRYWHCLQNRISQDLAPSHPLTHSLHDLSARRMASKLQLYQRQVCQYQVLAQFDGLLFSFVSPSRLFGCNLSFLASVMQYIIFTVFCQSLFRVLSPLALLAESNQLGPRTQPPFHSLAS